MLGEADLRGHCILVVEDDYYLATDAERILRKAGADVLGPFPNEVAASAELERTRPDAALIDINLGTGPSFGLAEHLNARDIPFAFITGYDASVIPPAFAGVERIQKPTSGRTIVGAVLRLMRQTA